MIVVDTVVAALHYGVTDRTVRRWVALGWLVNHGTARRVQVELHEHAPMSATLCSTGDVSPTAPP